MKRRTFIQKSTVGAGLVGFASSDVLGAQRVEEKKQLYELRVYETRWTQAPLDEFFSKALIPALNRLGVKKVGAFTELTKSEPAKLYFLIPYSSFEDFGKVNSALNSDKEFQQLSANYNSIPQEQAVYSRYESSLLLAFDGIPQLIAPPPGPRIFELRTYEGYSEDAVRRKVKMFNDAELDLFKRTKLNSVFFGQMIAGKNLPCLVYMLAFKDMAEREKNWKTFVDHPEWKTMSQDPQYANTVSKIYKTFLEPLSYSQI
jgi:hypothetical protein